MSGEIVGIIYPPPELRNIVDKTASFVARNGPEFESRIQQNEQNNPKFNFLKTGDPYNAYYQHKCKEFRDGGSKSGGEIVAGPTGPSFSASSTPGSQSKQQSQTSAANKTSKQMEQFVETPIIPREPPPDYEFMEEPPSISALDLDVVKLTAQFVAIHGRSFLTNLMNREQRNYQFDFLRPQHGLFNHFTQLIEQYAKIHTPSKNVTSLLSKELDSNKLILDKVRYRVEWTKVQEAEKRREEEEAEKERIQYAQIDWHDFVIVETVDYQPHEQGLFPPPTTPERVGSRILLQQRIEEQGQEAVEMDVDSDEENAENKEDSAAKQKESMPPPPLPPLPPQLDNVLIRKDYNPKSTKAQPQQTSTPARPTDSFVISPITGEKIPADKLQEHMRFGLLDPRWVEQRDRSIQEKMAQEEVYAVGSAIESSLKQLAERRTDIFGSGDEETVIGKKIGEEEHRKPEKGAVVWDGHTASVEAATRAARANITIEEQIQQIHKIKGLLPEDDKDKIGPALPATSSGGAIISAPPITSIPIISAPPKQPMISTPSMSIMTTTINAAPPVLQPPQHMQTMPSMSAMQAMHSHQHPHQQMMPPMMMGQMGQPGHNPFMMAPHMMPHMANMGLYGMPMPPPHDMTPNMAPIGVPPPNMAMPFEEEPAAKKQRTEENLIPEEEFLAKSGPQVTIKVQVPQSSEKPEWKLTGQTLTLTLPLTDTISVVKTRIHEQTLMPPGKQKLQFDGMFVKDSNSLAFYNMSNDAVVVLGLKERGGRKK